MFKNILNTVFVRVLNGFFSFLIVIINSKNFGAEGLGTIGLIVLAISIFVLINSLVGGGTFIYFVPKINNFKLFILSYLWTLISLIIFVILIQFINLAPSEYLFHIAILAVLFSLTSIHSQILAGNERIKRYNFISLITVLTTIISLLILINIFNYKTIKAYIISLYISYLTVYVISFFSVIKYLKNIDFTGLKQVFLRIVKLGSVTTIAGITQKLNYRLSYYFLEFFSGMKAVGKYSVGVQLSESTWIIGRSMAIVQYSKISNIDNEEIASHITKILIKISVLISILIVTVLLIIPPQVYSFIFGEDFNGTGEVILSLSIGIVALSCSFMISHYFSGLGKPKYNMYASVIGLVVTASAGFLLIPDFGIIGAGITTSLSYSILTTYQLFAFVKFSKSKFSDFLIRKQDYIFVKNLIRNIFIQKIK